MLFEMARSLRSLTRSPIESILHAARRMARPGFEEGGTVPHEGRVDHQNDDGDLVLPSDVREEEVLSAIEDLLLAKRFSMPKSNNGAVPSLKMTADGKVIVPAALVLQLGDGAVDRGKRVLEKIVGEIRHRRVLSRLAAIPAVKSRR